MNDPHATALDRIAELIGSGRPDLAEQEAGALRLRAPRESEAARLHGIALLQLGRVDDALAAFEHALMLEPRSVEVLCNLGSARLAAGRIDAAVATFERALQLAAGHPAALNGLGNALRARGDSAGARDAYAAATRAQPGHVGAWCNLAAAELALGDAQGAERSARHAAALAPGHPEALFVLGHALAAQHRHADAEAAYAAGERSAPHDARFPYQRGLMAEEQRKPAIAASAHARALALDPTLDRALSQLVFLRRQLCDWRGLDALAARLRSRVAASANGISPFAFLAEHASAIEQLQCARTHAQALDRQVAPLRTHRSPRTALGEGPLRLGFVANGFGNHPTALLVVALFEALRAHDVRVHLYSTAPNDHSPMLQRLRVAADVWHDASKMTSEMLANAVGGDAIDILLDLDGYCSGAMPQVFALRPAPLQVNWLAYPGTLGAPWMDYVIADRIVLPDDMRAAFSEKVAWLPRCFQPSDPGRPVGTPPSREACGLPAQGVVFASLNNSYKINAASFERMIAVLREVPGSVLWLLSAADGADQRLRDEANARGFDASRLVFAPKLPHLDYLARYRHADLFLDCSPYGAHTTASDAVWAGCPVLTIPGSTFAARVAASMNHHLGLPQLNARDDAEFIATAIHLGRDAAARTALRSLLVERRAGSGLFDMQAYASDFVALLQRMAERHRDGLPPAHL